MAQYSGHPCIQLVAKMSTGHLDTPSRTVIDEKAWDRNGGDFAATEGGWFCPVPQAAEDDPTDAPEALRLIFAFCRTIGADYLLFDCDADEVPELAVYDDSGALARHAIAPAIDAKGEAPPAA